MYAEVCSCVSCRLYKLPIDALCGRRFVGVLEFIFDDCFEVGEFSDVFRLVGRV